MHCIPSKNSSGGPRGHTSHYIGVERHARAVQRERESVCVLHLSSHTGLTQVLPGHALAEPGE